MKEYIKETLYESSGLLIGKNGKGSIILGQGNSWIVLDRIDVKHIAYSLSQQKEKDTFDGFNFLKENKNIRINQHGHSISMDRLVFQQELQCNSNI